jgi:hypothetical protein
VKKRKRREMMMEMERRRSKRALQISQTLELKQSSIEMRRDGSPSTSSHTKTPPSIDTMEA